MSDTSGFIFDFTQVREQKPLVPGDYLVECIEATVGASQSSGNPMITTRWKVVDGPDGVLGRQMREYLVFSDKEGQQRRIRAMLRNLGFPADFAGTLNDIASQLLGIQSCATVGIETDTRVDDEGKQYEPRNRISAFKSEDKYIGQAPEQGGFTSEDDIPF